MKSAVQWLRNYAAGRGTKLKYVLNMSAKELSDLYLNKVFHGRTYTAADIPFFHNDKFYSFYSAHVHVPGRVLCLLRNGNFQGLIHEAYFCMSKNSVNFFYYRGDMRATHFSLYAFASREMFGCVHFGGYVDCIEHLYQYIPDVMHVSEYSLKFVWSSQYPCLNPLFSGYDNTKNEQVVS